MPNGKSYNILIVDDELQARKLLTLYVAKIPNLNLIAAVRDAIAAKAIMQEVDIDILLLDIHMPEISGLEFARSIQQRPEIIFTTAFSEYAIEGFELNVVDYLLKPIAFNRFFQAISKATDKLLSAAALKGIETTTEVPESREDHMIIHADHRIYKVYYCDLLYIEGQREYVTFHTLQRRITAYYSLKRLEEELPTHLFARVHKSYIVALSHIEIVESGSVIINQQSIPIGKNYRGALLERFKT